MESFAINVEHPAISLRRLERLAPKLTERGYRDHYVAAHTRQFLARQIRAFRGELSQAAFGKVIDKPQSVVSRLEDPNYGKWTLQSLFEVARTLDVAVIVRFVDYPTFMRYSEDLSENAAKPQQYSQEAVESVVREAEQRLKTEKKAHAHLRSVSQKQYRSLGENIRIGHVANQRRLRSPQELSARISWQVPVQASEDDNEHTERRLVS